LVGVVAVVAGEEVAEALFEGAKDGQDDKRDDEGDDGDVEAAGAAGKAEAAGEPHVGAGGETVDLALRADDGAGGEDATPAVIASTTRIGSTLVEFSISKNCVCRSSASSVIAAAASDVIMWVRRPAGRRRSSRSRPTSAPSSAAIPSRPTMSTNGSSAGV
jgi:hypothetical protein